ncbi:hypothetical protein BDN70DRAFT_101076 [Pholiota conissans]|uniref:Uncharacterized protein n=1 Tax=Pholiota conissans TaxID=109636 RepID=A0A9P6CZD9_9AGAR|nr:hypothetical protein BDN70DRAFT_101076 [Pholiota conissans]
MASKGSDQSLLDAGVRDGSFVQGSSSDLATIVGSYNESFQRPTFPQYSSVSSSCGVPQIYCRSMLSSGHGFGPSNITGDINRPAEHIYDGANIGDVGYVDEYGAFVYCFNIFQERNDPLQPKDIPATFVPLPLPLSNEDVTFIPDYHSPGTVVVSEGVHVSRVEESPLRLDFSSSVREGAVLVLPAGASREDLIDPSKFYTYIKNQAARWYQEISSKCTGEKQTPTIPNGTLHFVTGVDRASSWATATFPYRRIDPQSSLNFQYDEASDPSWKNAVGLTTLYRHHKESSSDGTVGAVFLRFLSIAVNLGGGPGASVMEVPRTMAEDIPRHVLPASELQGTRARFQKLLGGFSRKDQKVSPCPHEIVFNPSTILLQVLLRMDPSAEVALVPDSVWRSQLSGRHMTHAELMRLMNRIIKNYSVITRDDICTFSPNISAKEHESISSVSERRRPDWSLLQQIETRNL